MGAEADIETVGAGASVDPREALVRDTELVAVTSHEMRGPLAAIKGFTDLLRDRHRELDPDHVDSYLSVICDQTAHLIRLTDDLLVLANESAAASKAPIVAEEGVAIVPLVERVVTAAGQPERVTVIAEVDAPSTIETDPMRLERALRNLLENALKYSAESAEPVTVTIRSGAAGSLRLEVADRGVGIAPEDLDHIFELFYRTPDGARVADGSGLGLAITRAVTETLGGEVSAAPREGGGSVFTLRLPARLARSPRR
jgi:signal transduction histidine kinase